MNPATETREEMERMLDYEIQGSWFYPFFPVIEFIGFLPLMSWWFGKKVTWKYERCERRGTVIDEIIASRGPHGGFHG